jgi:TRAP-type C4-dicarboxylate transport system permease small subunit
VEIITKLDRLLAKTEEVVLALLLVGMVLLAALQVLLRNIWDTGIDWADISLQNATLLLGLLGAAIATSEGRHLNIDIFSRVLKGRSRTLLKVVIGLFCTISCILLARGGWSTYRLNYAQWVGNIPAGWTAGQNLKAQFFEGNIPQWLTQATLPMGFGLIGFHFLLRLVRDVRTLITGQEWEAKLEVVTEGDEVLEEMERRGAEEQGGAS